MSPPIALARRRGLLRWHVDPDASAFRRLHAGIAPPRHARVGRDAGSELRHSRGVSDEVRIRAATQEDADCLARVFIASFGTLTFLPKLHTDEETFDFIANSVIREQDVLLAEVDGAPVGFVAMAHGNFVEHLYVHPDRQRRGVGSTLLRRAKERMPEGFRLWVFQQNTAARRFYERHGLHLVELTDGADNEEKTPDALYQWRPKQRPS